MLKKLEDKALRGYLNFTQRVRKHTQNEKGDAVIWIVVIILGIIIAVSAYLKFKGAGGTVGNAIDSAGTNAANGLNSVKVE